MCPREPAATEEDFQGTLVTRGEAGYEAARSAAVWNARRPQRFPEIIVRAATEADVAHAVTYARTRGLRISMYSGGHNWSGSPLRDRGLLLDLSALRECHIAPAAGDAPATATVGPAATGRELVAALTPRDLAFPVGHCPTVAVGGFLLSGGLGWNSRAWGASCADVLEIRAVTADGRTVTCSDTENPDLFWAARGAGPGFCAVVTRFRLALHPHPASIMTTSLTFPLTEVARVTKWAERTARGLPPYVETAFALMPPGPRAARRRRAPDHGHRDRVRHGTQRGPAGAGAVRRLPLRRARCRPAAGRTDLLRRTPRGRDVRLATGPPVCGGHPVVTGELRHPADPYRRCGGRRPLREVPGALPGAAGLRAPPLLRNMAFAPLGESYLVCYAIWEDPAEDEAQARWLREAMAAADPQGNGFRYIAETDLEADAARARRSYTPAAWDRLQEIKAQWDPDNLFHSYLAP